MKAAEIGSRIREQRQKKGYSQQWMSSKLGISQTTYNRIENGTVDKVSPEIYAGIAELLDVHVSKLLFSEYRQVFFNCQQSGEIGTIHNHSAETLEFLKIIQAQMEALQKQMILLNSLLQNK